MILLALVATGSLLSQLFQAAARSAVPDLVGDDDLEHANALIGGGAHGLEALGPLLAAVLLPFVSLRGLLAIDVVTFLVSALLLAGLPGFPGSLHPAWARPSPPPPGSACATSGATGCFGL